MNFKSMLFGGIIGGFASAVYCIIRYEKPLEEKLKERDEQLKHSLKNTNTAIGIAKYWEEQCLILEKYLKAFTNQNNNEG